MKKQRAELAIGHVVLGKIVSGSEVTQERFFFLPLLLLRLSRGCQLTGNASIKVTRYGLALLGPH
jgi:hypothetical protein